VSRPYTLGVKPRRPRARPTRKETPVTDPSPEFLARLEAGRARKQAQVCEQAANATGLTPPAAGKVIVDLLAAGFEIVTPGGTHLSATFRADR
jgi:hypothetical protein